MMLVAKSLYSSGGGYSAEGAKPNRLEESRPSAEVKRRRFYGCDKILVTMTNTRNREETLTGERVRTEPPWNVILHNSWHPVSWVVYALVKTIPGVGVKKATRIMWTAHTEGRAVAKSCHKELAELYQERLREKGLTVTLEPAR